MSYEIGTQLYYEEFLNTLLNQLDWQPYQDAIAWHYTSGAGLIGIIESGTIYSTQVSCLNDATEIRYSAGKLREELTKLLAPNENEQGACSFVRSYIEMLQDTELLPNSIGLPYFVSCFTTLKDDLGQWRSYGGGENGYAIGIRVRDLFGVNNSLVANVVYNVDKHTDLATQAAVATFKFYKEGVDAGIAGWDDLFRGAWDAALTKIAPVIKDPGFELEKEIRLIHQLQERELADIRVIQKKTMMARHYPIRFPSAAPTHRPRIPLCQIVVGPSRHKEISRVSVDTLLRTHGYPSGIVTASALPYQEM